MLHLISIYGRVQMLELVASIYPSIDFDVADDFGDTPLISAVKTHNSAMVSRLIALGANPNAKNVLDDQDSPLHYACLEADLPTIRVLLAAGGDVNAENQQHVTPLMYSRQKEVTEVVRAAGGRETGPR